MGGRNAANMSNTVSLYKFDQENISFQKEAIIVGEGTDASQGDFFPQNQWIVTEQNSEKSQIILYSLGRYFTYCVSFKWSDERYNSDQLTISASQANKGLIIYKNSFID